MTSLEDLVTKPDLLLDTLDADLSGLDPEIIPLIAMDDSEEAEGPYRGVTEGRAFHRVIDRWIGQYSENAHLAICKQFGYCHQAKRHKDTIELVRALIDVVLSTYAHIPIPAAHLSCYLVQSQGLDRLCRCAHHESPLDQTP